MSNTQRNINPAGIILPNSASRLDKKKNQFPKKVPDGMQSSPHYVSGEYPGNGWRETFTPNNAGRNKKISNRIKRAKEKQKIKKDKFNDSE